MGQIRSEQLFKALESGRLARVYLCIGEEEFLMDEALSSIEKQVLQPETRDLNRERLDARTTGPERILQSSVTVPCLGPKRLVIVDRAGAMSLEQQKKMALGLRTIPDSTVMVFRSGEERLREALGSPLATTVAELGEVVVFWPLHPREAHRWVVERARALGKDLEPDAVSLMVEEAGTNLRILVQELENLVLYVGNKRRISVQDVAQSLGYKKEANPYDLGRAIRGRHTEQALTLMEQLLEQGEDPIYLIYLIGQTLRELRAAKEEPDRNASTLWAKHHVKRGEENQFWREIKGWKEGALEAGLEAALEAEVLTKTGKEVPRVALTLLVLRLGGAQRAYTMGQS